MSSILTPIGMLSFPQLFVPKPPAPGAEERFGCNLVFDKNAQTTPEWVALKQAVAAAIDEKWGTGKSRDKAFVSKLRMPWRSCSDRDYTGYDVDGGVFIAPWSKNKPGIVGPNGKTAILIASDVWSGQLARATVHPFCYDTSGNKGVNLNLNNLQIAKLDMPRLDGRKKPEDEFDAIGDAEAGDTGVSSNEPPF
jgi:hypothetical protein